MKNLKLFAAIAIAAMMIVCVGAVAISAPASSADGSGAENEINYQNIPALMTYSPYTPNPNGVEISADSSVADLSGGNTVWFLKENYSITHDATIRVGAGEAIAICPVQTFSITTAKANFEFMPGAKILIVNVEVTNINDPGLDPDTGTKLIYEYEFESSTSLTSLAALAPPAPAASSEFKGKISNVVEYGIQTPKKLTFTVDKNTTITSSDSVTKFIEENKLEVSLDQFDLSAMKVTGSIKTNINFSVDAINGAGPDARITITGSPEYGLSISPSDKDVTATITGEGRLQSNLDLVEGTTVTPLAEMTLSNDIDIDVVVKDYGTDKQEAFVNGHISISFETTDLEFVDEESQISIEMSDVYEEFNIDIDNNVVEMDASFGVGYLSFDSRADIDDQVGAELSGLDVHFNYRMVAKEDTQVLALATPNLSSLAAKGPSPDDIKKAYFDGLAKKPADMSVKEYAANFFFGMIDDYNPAINVDMESDYLEAEVNVKSLTVENVVELKGLNVYLEISDSVGLEAKASVDRLYVTTPAKAPEYPGDKGSDSSKIMVEPLSFEAYISDEENVFLEIDASFTGGVKQYNWNDGMLTMNAYVNGLSLTYLLEKDDNVLDDLGLKSAGVFYYGSLFEIKGFDYVKATETEAAKFTIDSIDVGGDFYGDAPIMSVEGSIKGITIPADFANPFTIKAPAANPDPFAAVTIDSVNFTVTDIYGSTIEVDRYNEENTIINDVEIDGAVWLKDVLGSDSPASYFMALPVGTVDANTKQAYNFTGVALLNSHAYYTVDATEIYPAFEYGAQSQMTINIDGKDGGTLVGKFTGELYVTRSNVTSAYGYTNNNAKFVVGPYEYTVDAVGAAVGIVVKEDGTYDYKMVATPGYELSKDQTATGFTWGDDFNAESSSITVPAATGNITYAAVAKAYKLYIDGEFIEDCKYCALVTKDLPGVFFLFDENGAIVGSFDGDTWSYRRIAGDGDLELSSIKLTPVTVENKIIDLTSSSVSFTLPATGDLDKLAFVTESKLRIALVDANNGDKYSLVAEDTKFNGHDAFMIKAYKGDGLANSAKTKLYFPVDGTGMKVMHVDKYGRAAEQQSTYVVIGEQAYQMVEASSYSIFYLDDDKPLYDTGGNGKNNNYLKSI